MCGMALLLQAALMWQQGTLFHQNLMQVLASRPDTCELCPEEVSKMDCKSTWSPCSTG